MNQGTLQLRSPYR